MKNNNLNNKTSYKSNLTPNPWEKHPAPPPSQVIFPDATQNFPSLSCDKNPLIEPSNPPGTLKKLVEYNLRTGNRDKLH